jgi:hypothetical protein
MRFQSKAFAWVPALFIHDITKANNAIRTNMP